MTQPEVESFIWNDPSRQFIAIQERQSAFQRTDAVVKGITEAVNDRLGKNNLRAHFEPMFHEKAFWNLAEEYRGKIKDIEFELITPNLANISDVLPEELKEFAKGSNAAQTKINIIADPDSSIMPNREDPRINGLVKYASDGGGDISIKIRGISKRTHTQKSKKRVDIEEAIITGDDPQKIAEILKAIIE